MLATGFALGGIALLLWATLIGMEETDKRRKNYHAGTHDYYGNKIKNNKR